MVLFLNEVGFGVIASMHTQYDYIAYSLSRVVPRQPNLPIPQLFKVIWGTLARVAWLYDTGGMDAEIDLNAASRDVLIAIIVQQQAIIERLKRRIAQLESQGQAVLRDIHDLGPSTPMTHPSTKSPRRLPTTAHCSRSLNCYWTQGYRIWTV